MSEDVIRWFQARITALEEELKQTKRQLDNAVENYKTLARHVERMRERAKEKGVEVG